MKNKIIILFICSLLQLSNALAKANECFYVKNLHTNKTLKQEGNICKVRLSPASTFKIALSLMGYDAKILKDTKKPVWPYCACYKASLPIWRSAHNPTTWIKNSCVWYSQILTKKLGMKKFKKYVYLLDYGNKDVSGTSGKNNGLTTAWLSSSLKISNQEQASFLEKMLNKKFPLSNQAYNMTKQILFIEKLNNGWSLYGKTGAGFKQNPDGSTSKQTISWFIGFATKNGRTVIFAKNVIGKNTQCSELKDSVRQFLLKRE